jgi:iron complex outermembrane receptor protein
MPMHRERPPDGSLAAVAGWEPRGPRANLAGVAFACMAGASQASMPGSLADLTLEQLSEVVVTTVSRREERLEDVAASVFVISNEDIRRSGATSLPEVLRLAPQLNVARADANQYAISARGFNNVLANKMLVLIDGRTAYTPLFSGVFWEAQNVLLEDIERIEVVTGPSAALWGTNAVNGLIHVITRSAALTQGAAASVHAGGEGRGAAARYGGRLSRGGHFRLYAQSWNRDHTELADGRDVRDEANGVQAGFRADWGAPGDAFTLEGDVYRADIDQEPSEREISGGHVLGRWERALPGESQLSLQVYAERTERDHPLVFAQTLDTIDGVVQYAFRPSPSHRMLVGAGYRHSHDKVDNRETLAFQPARVRQKWSRVFAQDQIGLGRSVEVTLSASAEHNPYTGTEFLPSVRVAWRASASTLLWGSLSRAVRAPSRIDRDLYLPPDPPFFLAGGPDFDSEVSVIAELGVRTQPTRALSYGLTAFHHEHERLRSVRPTADGLTFDNDIEGSTAGLQGWLSWRVMDRWRLSAGGVMLRQDLHVVDGRVDVGGLAALGNDPREWASVRSSLDITPTLAWDVAVRHVGSLPDPHVSAYTATDMRLAWRLPHDNELSLVVRNLFDPRHAEWGAEDSRTEFRRTAWLQWRWRL